MSVIQSLTQLLAMPRNKCVTSEETTPFHVDAMVSSLLLDFNYCLEFGIYDIGLIQIRSVFWIPRKMWIYLTIGLVVKSLESKVAHRANTSRDLVFSSAGRSDRPHLLFPFCSCLWAGVRGMRDHKQNVFLEGFSFPCKESKCVGDVFQRGMCAQYIWCWNFCFSV